MIKSSALSAFDVALNRGILPLKLYGSTRINLVVVFLTTSQSWDCKLREIRTGSLIQFHCIVLNSRCRYFTQPETGQIHLKSVIMIRIAILGLFCYSN